MPQRKSDSTAPSSVEDRQQSPLNPLLQHHRIISNNHIFFHQAPPSLLTASEPSTPASWSPAGSRASTPIPYSFGRPPPTSSSIGGLRLPDFAAIPGFSASLAAFAAASSASPAPSTTPSSPLVSGIPGYFPPFSSSSSAAAAAGVLPYPTPTTETSGPPSWFTSGPTVMPAMFAAAVPSPILAGLPMPKDGGGMSLPPTPMTASLPTTTTTAVDAAAMHAHLAYNMLMASSTTSVAAVTAPPVPLGLSLRIGGVPAVGAKSRVETQIKFVVELVSATTGEKAVGMYQQLRLPDLLIANDRWKRAGDMRGSSSSSTAAAADTSSAPGTPAPSDSAPGSPMRCPTGSDNDTVWLHARVVRGSNSSEEVRVCDVCVLREVRF
ncbi:hypothetical protein BC828DRAFT_406134 [Blastocladiella britannica]|nr:hypothetical protein BC828DRAFT_406134 [Blastocladiella britannica]